MSGAALVSPGTRLPAPDSKATKRPSALWEGRALDWFASSATGPGPPPAGAGPTLTRVVVRIRRSRTKMSARLLVSLDTRLVASELKATNRPSAEIEGVTPLRIPGAPSDPKLIH